MAPRPCAIVLLLVPLFAAAAPPSVDDVYAALGRGDDAVAHASSATLVRTVGETSAQRADALQARLDTLDRYGELDGEDGLALADAIARHAASGGPRAMALAARLAIFLAIAHKQVERARTLAHELVAAPVPSPIDNADALYLEAHAEFAATGRLDAARDAAQRALQAWSAQHGVRRAWHDVQLHVLLSMAWAGDKNAALKEIEQAAALATRHFGADSYARIDADTERAGVLVSLGRNSEALAVRQGVLEASVRRYGELNVRTAKSAAMVGASLQELGDYPAARAQYARAEQILAATGDSEPAERALIAGNFGNLLQEMGEEDAALEQYRKALAVYGDNPQRVRLRAITYANIGNTEFRLRRYDDAIADYQRALALREQADGANAPGLAFSLEGLGSATLALGRHAEAERYFRRAIEVRRRGAAADHPTLAVYNFGIALALWGQGRSDEALRFAEMTARSQQTVLTTFAAEFSERQSVAYRDILVPATALAVSIAAERGDVAAIEKAWNLVMAERRLVARTEARKFAAVRAARDPALAPLRERWLQANSALGGAWLDVGVGAERLAQLRADAENAEHALSRAGDPVAGSGDNPTIAELARGLPADGTLIAFSEGISGDLARLLVAGDKPVPEIVFAFVLGPDGRPALRRVATTAALAATIRAWHQELRDPRSDRDRLRRDGLAVRRLVLDPLVSPAAARHLFVVPEGELFRASLAALPDDADGWLIERGVAVHTLAQESDLLDTAGAPASALLAGAPAFTQPAAPASADAGSCADVLAHGFAPLPNAGRELDALRKLLADADPARRIEVITGKDATRERVIEALPRASIVHVATHAFSVDSRCAENGNLRGVSLQPRTDARTAAAGALEAVSGLAFTATGSAQAGALLGANELSGLDLSQAQWVALSACDTGVGPVARNEGVFGMRRALRLAGARTVVMSLWPVDDATTADLMLALYRARFVDHRDVAESMASAMRNVIDARRAAGASDHPFYWAAFVSEGAWR